MLVACTLPSCSQVVKVNGFTVGPTSFTNNPVSMVFESKHVQTLADGTHITTSILNYFYRDTLGRTRTDTETPAMAGKSEHPRSIFVQDPVAGITLNWESGQTGSTRQYTRATIPAVQPHAPVQRNPAPIAPAKSTDPGVSKLPPATAGPQFKHEDLGMLQLQGASCKASRITVTFPVGLLGNDRPIVTTQDQCASQEFGRILLEVNEDPRTGTRTLSVQSITRGEPDPSLFQPPPGYAEHVLTPPMAR